jgi:hemerythrin superfamily protein
MMKAAELIKHDHETVHGLFLQLDGTPPSDGPTRQSLLDRIVEELEIHAKIEEDVFYPALRAVSRRIDDAEAAHNHVKTLIGEAEGLDPTSAEFTRKVRQLEQSVLAHVAEEEGGILLEAGRLGADEMTRLGAELEARKQHLKTSGVQRGVRAVKQAARKVA